MHVFKKIFKIIWLLSLIALIFAFFQKNNLPTPEKNNSQLLQSPRQSEITLGEKKDIQVKYGEFDYKITPIYNYELWGLVVSGHDSKSWMDSYHKTDPFNTKDICVVWGENLSNGVYEKMKFTSGEWSCNYQYKYNISQEWYTKYDLGQGSNNHLLPQNEQIAIKIKNTAIGGQIHLKGYLVNYTISQNGQIISGRNSSTVRTDTEEGNCEVVYVTDFETILPGNIFYHDLFKWSKYVLFISTIIIIIFFIAAPVE